MFSKAFFSSLKGMKRPIRTVRKRRSLFSLLLQSSSGLFNHPALKHKLIFRDTKLWSRKKRPFKVQLEEIEMLIQNNIKEKRSGGWVPSPNSDPLSLTLAEAQRRQVKKGWTPRWALSFAKTSILNNVWFRKVKSFPGN